MRLVPNRWRLVSIRTIEKGDKKYSFLTFANTETYETNDFMAGRELDVTSFAIGLDYDVTLEVDGKFMNVVGLKSASATVAKAS